MRRVAIICAVLAVVISTAAARRHLLCVPEAPASGGPAACDSVNDSSLKAYWKLDETSGTRSDSKGANHLTDNNTVTSGSGKVGNSAHFAAANSEYLSITDNADVSTGDVSFTIAAWVRLDSKTTHRIIVGKDPSGSTREYLLFYNVTADRFSFNVWNAAQTTISVNATTLGSPSVGTWYFIVAWFDNVEDKVKITATAASAGSVGATDASAASSGFIPLDWTNPFQIGAFAGSSLPFDGDIDEVLLTKRLLTSGEITALYNAGSACRPSGL
jgi:hypothetical protein